MWRTQYGDRALGGAEAILFAEALSSLLDFAIVLFASDYQNTTTVRKTVA